MLNDAVGIVFVSAFRETRHDYYGTRGRCTQCGYNLAQNTSGICPECGHER